MKSILILGLALFTAAGAQAKTIEVKMKNMGKDGMMSFEPGFVQAAVGDTIKFTPTDQAHNSTSVLVPKGATPWVGKMNQAVTVTLKTPGVYIYKCDPHLPMAMVGVIQVGAASNLEDAKAEAKKLAAGFSMNKNRLDKYLDQVK